MGKKKLTIIDDSQPEVEDKKQKKSNKNEGEAKVEEASRLSEAGEISSESTSSDVLEPERAGTEQSEAAELEKQAQPNEQSETKPKKAQKPGKSKKVRSKKYQEKTADLDKSKSYPLSEAVDLVKKLSYSKFTGSLETHINTTVSGIRGLVSLPFASGKKLTILAFGKGAEESGADIIGSGEVIDSINKGKVNFDLVVTAPDWMPKLAKIARILGPRGLMPNPKNGTITTDLKKSVEGFQAGKTEYKTESKAAVIHLSMGKLDQPDEELAANIKTLIQTIGKTRVKKVSISPTMGPSVKVDLASL